MADRLRDRKLLLRYTLLLSPLLLMNIVIGTAAEKTIAIGDSITEQGGWVHAYDPMAINEGRSGETSAQILDRVENDPSLREEIARAYLVLLQAGTNDLAQGVSPTLFCTHWVRLIAAVRVLAPRANIIAQDIYHWIPAVLDNVTVMNACIRSSGVRIARVESLFDNHIDYLRGDAIHPNAAGDTAIIKALHMAN